MKRKTVWNPNFLWAALFFFVAEALVLLRASGAASYVAAGLILLFFVMEALIEPVLLSVTEEEIRVRYLLRKGKAGLWDAVGSIHIAEPAGRYARLRRPRFEIRPRRKNSSGMPSISFPVTKESGNLLFSAAKERGIEVVYDGRKGNRI